MFCGGTSGSEEGDELQHQQLGESVPGIGSFYVKRDQVLRRRRRDFVKLKRSQKVREVRVEGAHSKESMCPGPRLFRLRLCPHKKNESFTLFLLFLMLLPLPGQDRQDGLLRDRGRVRDLFPGGAHGAPGRDHLRP